MEEAGNDDQHQAFANQLSTMIANQTLFQIPPTNPVLIQTLVEIGAPSLMILNDYNMQNKQKFPAFYEFTLANEQVPEGSKA